MLPPLQAVTMAPQEQPVPAVLAGSLALAE
jgi:hypothetical protein